MRIWLIKLLLRWLRYEPACIYVPKGSCLRLIARGRVELREDTLGYGPAIVIAGECIFEGPDFIGGTVHNGDPDHAARH